MLNELEVVEGTKLDKGYISPYFVTNAKTQKVVSTNEHRGLSNPKNLPIWCYFGYQPCMIYFFFCQHMIQELENPVIFETLNCVLIQCYFGCQLCMIYSFFFNI
jgi:hypothetical protein